MNVMVTNIGSSTLLKGLLTTKIDSLEEGSLITTGLIIMAHPSTTFLE
jgi:hypothetical protein